MHTQKNIDIVDIYQGGSTLATSDYVTSLSGLMPHEDLPTYISPNNFMIVRFTSDKSDERSGFQATITTGKTCLIRRDVFISFSLCCCKVGWFSSCIICIY